MNASEKKERLIEAAVALLDAAPNKRLKTTNLNKALFYLDLIALRDYGETITRSNYCAFENGPVVAFYKEALIDELAARNLAKQDEDGMSKPIVLQQGIKSFRYIDDDQRESAATIARHIGALDARTASDLSHKNPGWREARTRGERASIDMTLAMQQVIDQDPWLDQPLTADEKEALSSSADTVAWN
ncbi:type II toxin-antitoxin system antitoxin SocA domain-containing protein [Haliangium sp. UPWRP_2]|uniref:type II toxin-antitoxin system antitoxin SocA domain-containing protein n=1 Tax=Haliangium sp. UPWRP_2 TaxID=1931276 RepID=UPI000B540AE4|nr:type II toxin-antitoxin system antitoxin SocA domain-containing protein [Haliangium sp. UPWRP_2]PSM32365.1 DUF4065 domain-containing protein [Haliangium sp. UPWRP_2]HNN97716.1 DUF4065 domain-containing protein [Pseudomonadota bacterium]